jgi:two-component system CheB/CheR fusion protein
LSEVKKPLFIAAIGASAGGLSALKAFFSSQAIERRISYIVIQHLDVHGKQLAQESLSKLTSLPIVEITTDLPLEAGKVYVAPPHSVVNIEDEKFSVRAAFDTAESHAVIDSSFRNLAHALKHSLVGILFSGEGSDGSHGLKAIHEEGGLVIVQSPESSEHASMPQSALQTGIVDYTLRAEEIPTELAAYGKYVERTFDKSSINALRDHIGAALIGICEILQKHTKHDFKHYKTSTLIRRIQRRMQVLQLHSVESYIEGLEREGKEVEALFKELLINVTSFFRDPESFEELNRTVLDKAFTNRAPGEKFRMWIAGCSTGEEVYTFAILIKEQLAKLKNPPEVQILATDIDEHALNIARKGVYSVAIEESVSKERIAKYFIRRAGKYHVTKELRELCLFSSHNLINDPPFSQLDLISCRNVLIYLGTHLQKKLIPVFHYALKPGGFLFLGTSESLSSHKELFTIISSKHRIAERKVTAIRPTASFSTTLSTFYPPHFKGAAQTGESDIHLISQRIILDEFAPKYAVVNDESQILSVSSGLNEFLDPSEGGFQNNIVKLIKPALRMALRSTLSEAIKHKRRIDHESSTLKMSDTLIRIGITVQPMPKLGEESSLYMVVFHKFGTIASSNELLPDPKVSALNAAFIDQLERELIATRHDLDKTVQDLEASNEELKSSNEELLSMNEELQSANEELETSKEEVQESNEALLRSNSDLENLLASTQIATVFLDQHLRIKSYTPSLNEIYRIQASDKGREILDFTSRAISMPAYPDPERVTDFNRPIEHEVSMPDGRTYLRRILPYRTHEEKREGIVVTFINISEQKEMLQKLANNELRLETMVKTSPSFMCTILTKDFSFEQANARYYQLVGHRDIIGKKIVDALPEVKDQGFIELLEKVRDTAKSFIGTEIPFSLQRSPGNSPEKRYLDFVYQPGEKVDGVVERIYVHGNDVTEKVLAKASIANERENFRNLFKQTPEMVCILTGPLHLFEFVNEAHVRALGFDATGKTVREAQPESIEVHGILDRVYQTGVTAELNEIPVTLGDRLRYFNLTYAAKRNDDDEINGVMILGTEATEQVLSRSELERARYLAENASEAKSTFLANMSHEIRTPLGAIMGFSDLLVGSFPENSSANNYISRIKRNSGQLGRLVDELLDLSKIEAKRLDVELSSVDLNNAMEDAFAAVSLQAKEKGLVFTIIRLTDIPEKVLTDPTRFRQILINLVGNAIKFTETGSVTVELAATHKLSQTFLEVRITDTGIGLNPDQQKNLFQPFTQADPSITRKYGGTGLGLALSRELARLLGGDIALIRSAPNNGSTFMLTIALGTAEEITEATKPSAKISSSGQSSFAGRKILVVDDSPDNQDLVGLYLDQVNAEYEFASDGEEAIQKIKLGSYDLVLMDLQMPKLDGYTALKRLREDGFHLPVIALTAHALKSEREKCVAAGFNDYVTKPIHLQSLIEAMKRLVESN